MKEIISKMCVEVNEKYKKEISVTYEYIEESAFLSLFENTMMDIIDGYDRTVLTQETLIRLANTLYFQIILRWFFSLNDKKSTYEKGLERFVKNYLINPHVYNYLIENMPEFQALELSMSPKFQKTFAKGRKCEKVVNALSSFKSLGLNALINKSEIKRLRELVNNPIFREMIVALRLSGVWAND